MKNGLADRSTGPEYSHVSYRLRIHSTQPGAKKQLGIEQIGFTIAINITRATTRKGQYRPGDGIRTAYRQRVGVCGCLRNRDQG